MIAPSKNILVLLRRAPYQGARALEAVEVALVSGVFEQTTSVLFSGDGVWQLLPDQQADALGVRTLANILRGLPEYDIDALYVCARSLADRGLEQSALALDVTALAPDAVAQLIAKQDLVFND